MAKEALHIDRDDLMQWIDAHMYISGYKMKTVQRRIGKPKPLAGGIGNATFRIKKMNTNYYKHLLSEREKSQRAQKAQTHYKNHCEDIDLLCKLGAYTNVGGNRTAGMGVIRYFPKSFLDLN